MVQGSRLVDLVQSKLDLLIDDRTAILTSLAPEVGPLGVFSKGFLSGGKRFRALFCFWGWQAVHIPDFGATDEETRETLDTVVTAASALELFHAAALVHDDIIDRSDTRRGRPSAHREFERVHDESGYIGNAASFGEGAAILLGDLLLTWSDDLMNDGLRRVPDRSNASAARREYETMRLEVTAGQYLDLVEERAWATVSDSEALERAERVVLYKSAKYSVEAPLVIGAAMAGADEAQVTALRDFGIPLGTAFQLRDDLLGVFGDPAVTGKPSGDDLREGKRTVLVLLARANVTPAARTLMDDLLGDPDLSGDQVELLQSTIRQSGAVERVERMIDDNVRLARAALESAPLAPAAVAELSRLIATVTERSA
ncbi:polyprenyl synthetase family protein [Amnibacterium flavum]|uniref:Geranylgeranyl pyrophosphate synthase n=1 Tax=Amnibacterium flavum TaxID=2173173 RepID=A0A2V1HUH3_9MICO|nr:polyprenyl synthetase family protein [Amnibacterium flavum]PVZ94689.1 geranylgeranyl pyrophosphate synthase [Amnibacterium flavum]